MWPGGDDPDMTLTAFPAPDTAAAGPFESNLLPPPFGHSLNGAAQQHLAHQLSRLLEKGLADVPETWVPHEGSGLTDMKAVLTVGVARASSPGVYCRDFSIRLEEPFAGTGKGSACRTPDGKWMRQTPQ